MDVATRNTILELLPSELIGEILAMLDYLDLVSCMQVRRLSFGISVPRGSIRVLLTERRIDRCARPFSI